MMKTATAAAVDGHEYSRAQVRVVQHNHSTVHLQEIPGVAAVKHDLCRDMNIPNGQGGMRPFENISCSVANAREQERLSHNKSPLHVEVCSAADAGGGGGGASCPDHKVRAVSLFEMDSETAPVKFRFFAAAMYAIMSFGIMILTKSIFVHFAFHSFIFVGFLQYFSTVLFLLVQLHRGSVSFSLKGGFRILLVDIFPLPLVFMLNTLSGLGATQSLNMPLFVMLRRLSLVMTLFGESFFLRRKHNFEVYASVVLMLLGALVATSFQVELSMSGVALVLVNDVCTALNGVLTRRKLDEKTISAEGIMFYVNVFAAFFSGTLLLLNVRGDLDGLLQYNGWTPSFVLMLAMNVGFGFGINYYAYLCMKLNSPLTVSMIGVGKNILTSYVGMIFSDYTFAASSFLGINLSVLGCIVYARREIVGLLHAQKETTQQR